MKKEDFKKENKINDAPDTNAKEQKHVALDDSERIKIISPGMMVFKRFIRNKLAIVGTIVLIFMFLFCFIGAWISPYGESQTFYAYKTQNDEYATAKKIPIDSPKLIFEGNAEERLSNTFCTWLKGAYIKALSQSENDIMYIEDNNQANQKEYANVYCLKEIDDVFFLYECKTSQICEIKRNGDYKFLDSNEIYNSKEFKDAVKNAGKGAGIGGKNVNFVLFKFEVDGEVITFRKNYMGKNADGEDVTIVSKFLKEYVDEHCLIASTFCFDYYEKGEKKDQDFEVLLLKNLAKKTSFDYEDATYSYSNDKDGIAISQTIGENTKLYCRPSHYIITDKLAQDSHTVDYKLALVEEIEKMEAAGISEGKFEFNTIFYDKDGKPLDPQITEHRIKLNANTYQIRADQIVYVMDLFSGVNAQHWLGTDGNGMDVLTRIMYGGRISLMIGFIVIALEMVLGVLMGGMSGYFGGWIDTIIMRLVDIFNCIPFTPIMVMLGSVFDQMKTPGQERIMWLMVLMGVLGWSGIARLVRGQILFLREQEFMIAAEATGIKPSKRIFKHLVPNVMPQLIVNATMGLGGIILTESTLSFLGLGAKFPMATWGSIVNLFQTSDMLTEYPYIWIPVGILISVTVVAFNFVGDGLRDAFDPKMKR
ncbi:MAG: ABC transporter permease [Clostridia bacterium]